MAELKEFQKPYELRNPFAYSLRCVLCRMEVEHSEEQHDILRAGIQVELVYGSEMRYDD